jgi:hypothetical protein
MSCWPSDSTLIEKPVAAWMACPALVCLPTQNRTSGGSSDTEVKELAVIARIVPSTSRAITVTPVTNWPTVWRNVRASIGMLGSLQERAPPRS